MAHFELTVGGYFEAALRIADGEPPDHELHGRRFEVEVTFGGGKLNRLGMLSDERKLRAALAEVLSQLDHTYLNERPEFAETNPTAEKVAKLVYERMTPVAGEFGLALSEVGVRLHPDARVSYRP